MRKFLTTHKWFFVIDIGDGVLAWVHLPELNRDGFPDSGSWYRARYYFSMHWILTWVRCETLYICLFKNSNDERGNITIPNNRQSNFHLRLNTPCFLSFNSDKHQLHFYNLCVDNMEEMMKTFLVKNPPLLSIYQFCGYITGRALGFCIKISPYIYCKRP